MKCKILVGILAVTLAGCGKKAATGRGAQVEGKPVETGSPNAKDQQPAVAGQTRALLNKPNVKFATRVIAKGLEQPWAVALLPDGRYLVTERPGRLRIIAKDGTLGQPIGNLPKVDARSRRPPRRHPRSRVRHESDDLLLLRGASRRRQRHCGRTRDARRGSARGRNAPTTTCSPPAERPTRLSGIGSTGFSETVAVPRTRIASTPSCSV